MTATNAFSKAGQSIRPDRKVSGTKGETDIPILINDGTRVNSDGRVEAEGIRVDTIIPTPAELGEKGTPRRDQKSNQEIAEELRNKFRFEKPCYTHGAPGCDICLKTGQSLLRDAEIRLIKKWLMESAPLDLMYCNSNILALYEYLTEKETDVTPNNLLMASRLLDLKSNPKNRSGRIMLRETPSPVTSSPTYVFRRASPPPKPKRGRPAKPKKARVFASLRQAVGLTARQVADLIQRPDFNCDVLCKDYDAMMLDGRRDCYIDIIRKKRGWYRGRSFTTLQEFEVLLPDIKKPLFSDKDLKLYRDYAFNNATLDDLLLRGDLVGTEDRIIRRLQELKLANPNTCRVTADQTATDAVNDAHEQHKESESYGEGLSVVGNPDRRLSSFEHGGQIRRTGGSGSDTGDTGVDWGYADDDPIEE
jgi:hypothetical protein